MYHLVVLDYLNSRNLSSSLELETDLLCFGSRIENTLLSHEQFVNPEADDDALS
jgi:hypothetical protein